MITQVNVCNFGLFHQAILKPHPRLTIITGTTGTGKSLLFDAISLFCSKQQRRSPQPAHCNEPVHVSITYTDDAQDLTCYDRRSLTNTIYRCNQKRINQSDVIQTLENRILILQQFNRLWKTSVHNHMLYPHLCPADIQQTCTNAFNQWKRQKEKYQDMARLASSPEKARQTIQDNITTLESLGTYPSEMDELLAKQKQLMENARITNLIEPLQNLESLHEEALSDLFNRLATRINSAQPAVDDSVHDTLSTSLEDIRKGIDSLLIELTHLRDISYSTEALDAELTTCNQRIHTLRSAAIKYETTPDALNEKLQQFKMLLSHADSIHQAIEDAQSLLEALHTNFLAASERAMAAILHNAQPWCSKIQKHLERMEMPDTTLSVQATPLQEDSYTAYGAFALTLNITTNNQKTPAPPYEILSGGEFTRFLLAYYIVSAGQHKVLLLDEIDAGLSPQVCLQVGKLIRQLSKTHQIIAITHSPHIACFADKHYHVVKQRSGAHYESQITTLDSEEQRIVEMSRMIAADGQKSSQNTRNLILQILQEHVYHE